MIHHNTAWHNIDATTFVNTTYNKLFKLVIFVNSYSAEDFKIREFWKLQLSAVLGLLDKKRRKKMPSFVKHTKNIPAFYV
jgi:hypothetical protein